MGDKIYGPGHAPNLGMTDPAHHDEEALPECNICGAQIEKGQTEEFVPGIGHYHTNQRQCALSAYRLGHSHGSREGAEYRKCPECGELTRSAVGTCLACENNQERAAWQDKYERATQCVHSFRDQYTTPDGITRCHCGILKPARDRAAAIERGEGG